MSAEILRTEFSESFVQAMRDRMVVSYYKYGPVKNAYPHKVSAMLSLEKRIDKYIETGNTEWLVDAANFLMIEYMHPGHPKAHFIGTDAAASPGRVAHDEGVTTADNASLSDDSWKELQELRKHQTNE